MNPADSADIPTPRRVDHQTWTAEQVAEFLGETRGDRRWPAWVLAATTGTRRGEVLGMRWQDVDFDAGTVWIRQTVVAVGGRARISEPKTAAGRRRIALDDATLDVLRRWRVRQLEERLGFGSDYTGDDLIVCWPDGSIVDPNVLTKTFRRTVQRLGLPRIRLHDLRHTWATLALEAGIAEKVVADRPGHSSVVITLDTYTRVPEQLDRDAADRVAERFGL